MEAPRSPLERLQTTAELIGFGEDDITLIRASAEPLAPHAAAIVDAVYQHLLEHDATAPFFMQDGRPDQAFLAKRKTTLAEWLTASLSPALDEDFAAYVHRIGEGHRASRVPPAYLTSTISFAQTALAGLLDDAATLQAWNRYLILQLDLMLSAYETHDPTEIAVA